MKIATVGGGSTYTPELAQGLIERQEKLGLREWWLADTDPARLEVVGGFARRMAAAAGGTFRVNLTTDLGDALEGADFVITQIRVGGMAARLRDEHLGRRWNLVGQETTGIGGMACALRTVPAVLSLTEAMGRFCPRAWLINFTNPSGLVVEALQRHAPRIRSVGLCNSPIGYQMAAAKILGLPSPFEVHLDYLGLNHLAWIRGARVRGEDVWPRLHAIAEPSGASRVEAALGVVCNYYLQYYYCTGSVLEKQRQQGPSRAEEVMDIEKRLLEKYADPALERMPPELMERGGAYYSTAAAQLIEAVALDLGQVHIVNTRQADAVPGVPADWVMELPCEVRREGIRPLPAEPLPLFADGLMRTVKAYELLTVQAACTGDRRAALAALMAHPLGPDADRALEVLDDLLDTNREFLPRFFPRQAAPFSPATGSPRDS